MITLLADHLWQSTLVAAALGLLTSSLRKNAARLRYWIWFCASVKFLVPFALLVALGQQLGWRTLPALPAGPPGAAVEHGVEWGVLMERVAQPVAALAPSGSSPAPVVAPAALHVDLATVVLFVWATGTAIVLGVWVVRWLRLMTLVRRSHLLIESLTDDLPLEVRVSRTPIEPGVVGVLRPIVLLPDGIAARLTRAQLSTILEHELCHVRRRDNLTAGVHMLVEALFWFHPLVWWLGARLVDERERACDEAVLTATDDPQSYAGAIVAVCELCVKSPLACAAGIGGVGSLRERVERLLSAPGVRGLGALQRCVLGAAAVALVTAPIAIGVLNAPPARAQDSTTDSQPPAGGGPLRDVSAYLDPPGMWIAGPRVTATDIALRDLIARAFDLQRRQIVGPEALDTRRYTVVGELPSLDYGPGVDPSEQYRAYLRTLLKERFDLTFHRETTVVPALSLMNGAWNPNLRPTIEDERTQWFGRGPRPCWPEPCVDAPNHPHSIEARGVPIGALIHFLSGMFDMPVVDRTSLTGRYDFTFEWPADAARAERLEFPSNDVLWKVLDEQLGLRLLAVDAPIERLVVDRIEEPREATPASTDIRADPPAVILRDTIPSITYAAGLEIVIDRHGAMYLGHDDDLGTVSDPRSIVAIAKEAVRRDPTLTALVSADGMAANHRVVEAANLLAEAGVTRIRFATFPIRPNSVLDDSRSLNRLPIP